MPPVTRFRALGPILTAAAVFAALAFQPLAVLTVVTLFMGGSDSAAQPMVDGLPTPAALYWSPRTVNLVLAVGRLPLAAVLGLEICLYAILAYVLVRALNPTFRLTTGVDWDTRILTRTYMHTAPLIKAFVIAVAAFLPLALVWWLIALVVPHPVAAYVLQAAATGASVWVLFGRDGVAGDFDSGNYFWPSDRRVLRSLLARGAAAGAIAGLCARLAPFNPPDVLFQWQGQMAAIGEGAWWQIVALSVGLSSFNALAAAGACFALATPQLPATRRWLATTGWFALCLCVLWLGWVYVPGTMVMRYDFSGRMEPGVALSNHTSVPVRSAGSDPLLMVGEGRLDALRAERQSVSGLELGRETAGRVETYLRSRQFRTTVAPPAFATLMDAAALDWNDEDYLRYCWLKIANCPDPTYVRLFIDKLATCAASQTARDYAARLADERAFRYRDSESRLLAADLLARLGMRPEATQWYRLARVAESRIEGRIAQRTTFLDGVVSGRVLLDGKQLVGARVGLVRGETLATSTGLLAEGTTVPPFAMRTVSPAATTDEQGRFRLDHVAAGSYRTLIRIPGGNTATRYALRAASRTNGSAVVGYASKTVDLGPLDIITAPKSLNAPSRFGRGGRRPG